MKILVMPGYFYPTIGGIQKTAMSLVRTYQMEHHEVLVVTRLEKDGKRYELYNGIPIYRIKFSAFRLHPLLLIKSLILTNSSFIKLLIIVFKFKPGLIDVPFLSENAILASLLTYFYKSRLIVSLHGHDGILYNTNILNRFLYQRLLNKAEIIIFNSGALYAKAEKETTYRFDKVKVKLLPNSIDLEEFDKTNEGFILPNRRKYIFGCGNMIFDKGFDILIKGFALVSNEYPEIDLVIAGDGPERKNLESLVAALNIFARVHFLGFIPSDEINRHFLGCLFLVIPSRFEAFGIVTLEAMAARKAVVGSNTGGTPDLIKNGFNGYLFDNEDYQMLSQKMRLLIEDESKKEQLGKNGRRFVEENFSSKDRFKKILV